LEIKKFDKKQDVIDYQKNLNDDSNRRVLTTQRELRRVEDIIHLKHYFPTAKTVLCVGARDNSEVTTFIKYGYLAEGIDVCTESELITRMDVSDLTEDFGYFDIVYCSHVLEHISDAEVALNKINKISNQGVFITLPIVDRPPDIEHPTVYEIMKHDPSTNFKDNPYAWKDFNMFEPYKMVYNCYRKGMTEDFEIATIFKLIKG